MDLSAVNTFLHSNTVQIIIVLIAGVVGALFVYLITSSMSFEQSTSRRLGKFAGTVPTGLTEEIGGTVLQFYKRDTSQDAGEPGLGPARRALRGLGAGYADRALRDLRRGGGLVMLVLMPENLLFVIGGGRAGRRISRSCR